MPKIGRNAACPCGSGKKHKYCCLNRAEQATAGLTLANTTEAIAFGLRNEGLRVSKVRLVNNDTFLVEFVTDQFTSVDIKAEIATAIGFMNGFFRDNDLVPVTPKHFAAQAFTTDAKPLVHAISSRHAAEHLSNGRSLEWLNGTVFQEHTQEFKLGTAKRRIAELENGLRSLIRYVLSAAADTDWWVQCVGRKVRQQTEAMYERQEGIECSDGDTLIDFTFLLDLRRIIVSNWSRFDHVFPEQTRFAGRLEELNLIRRREAHNRELSDQDLEDLDSIHRELMTSVAQVVPDAASNYLLENWRNRLSEIFDAAAQSQVETVPSGQPLLAIAALRRQIERFEDIETQVASVVAPPAMLPLHDELMGHLSGVRTALGKMIRLETIRDAEKLNGVQLQFESANRELLAFREKYLLAVL